jgi:hypothetical protein
MSLPAPIVLHPPTTPGHWVTWENGKGVLTVVWQPREAKDDEDV